MKLTPREQRCSLKLARRAHRWKLSDGAFRLYVILVSLADAQGIVDPGTTKAQLANAMGRHELTAYKYINELKHKDLLTVSYTGIGRSQRTMEVKL